MEPISMWIGSNYFVDGNQNPFSVDHESLLEFYHSNTLFLFFFYNCCVFMHVVIFMNIVFGLGFSCIASEYIFLSHQKQNLMLCCVIISFNFGSIKFCNLCFALELLLEHWVVGYCYSFWFVFIVFLGNLNPNEACVPKMWKETFCLWKKRK